VSFQVSVKVILTSIHYTLKALIHTQVTEYTQREGGPLLS